MNQDCVHVCADCDKCQRYSDVKPNAGTTGMTQLTEQASRPMECIWMDFIGPYGSKENATERGNRCILIMLDDFTKWMKLYPLEEQTSKEVADSILDFTTNWGWPAQIKSDKGSNLISESMTAIYESMGVQKRESASTHPEGHAIIERAVQHVQKKLRTSLAGGREWDLLVNQDATSWNFAPHGTNGLSPYQILYGRQPRFAWQDNLPDTEDKWTVPAWTQHRIKLLKDTWEAVSRMNLKYKLDILQKARKRWKERKTEEYAPGDMVRVYLPVVPAKGLASKLQARYTSEYCVVKKIGRYTYKLRKQHTEDKRASVAVHVSRIKRYRCAKDRSELTPLTKITEEEQNNYGEGVFTIDEDTSDAILGMTEEGPDHDKRAAEALVTAGLIKSTEEAHLLLARIGHEIEDRILPGEEFVETENEIIIQQSHTQVTPHKRIPGELEETDMKMTQYNAEGFYHNDIPEEFTEPVKGKHKRNKHHNATPPSHTGEGDSGDDMDDSDSTKMLAQPAYEDEELETDTYTAQPDTSPQDGIPKSQRMIPGRRVKSCKHFKNIAADWGVSTKKLRNLNSPYWAHTFIKDKDRIPKNIILAVPRNKADRKYPAEEIGNWKQPFVIDKILGERICDVTNDDTGKTAPELQYYIRWDPHALPQRRRSTCGMGPGIPHHRRPTCDHRMEEQQESYQTRHC